MKAYYISDLVQNGPGQDTRISKIYQDAGIQAAVGSEGRLGNWALCLVDSPNHAVLENQTNIFRLPDISLDTTLGVLSQQQRNALLNKMTELGVDTSGITTQTPFREVVRRLGKAQRAEFNENNFDANL